MSNFTLHLMKKFAVNCRTKNKEEFKKQFAIFALSILKKLSVSENEQKLFLTDLDKNFTIYYKKLNKSND